MGNVVKASQKVVVIGAGPAGLAAAYRLCHHGIDTVILEKDPQVGGLCRTIRYKGNYFDIGGHRFYTRNKAVLAWWQGLLGADFRKVPRLSRIFYRGEYFDYPISIGEVLAGLGMFDAGLMLVSYLKSRLFPYPKERNLEEWTINRFGKRLYQAFFKYYSEKVWGIPCDQISADWAAERIRGVSVFAAVRHALSKGRENNIRTFIDEFRFPRLGVGMMYEAAAREVEERGGEIRLRSEVIEIRHDHNRITGVVCRNAQDGTIFEVQGTDYCSSMPITSLVGRMHPAPDKEVLEMCRRLRYRALVMVYLVVGRKDLFKDNWIYVHSPEVKVCRIQNLGNWSQDMVADPQTSALGMEYFCDEGDALWSRSDGALLELAASDLEALRLMRKDEVLYGHVLRVPKAYPIYDIGYRPALEVIKDFISRFSNLQCIGRYGMFHYNGMDHPVLTGFLAAKNIRGAHHDLWSVDLEEASDD
jgi:protoporphyrinogen oxidase